MTREFFRIFKESGGNLDGLGNGYQSYQIREILEGAEKAKEDKGR